ncbi:MAG: transglycosylase SLT domain-containing protein [Chloracidobacterium sp.]|uniref:Transglycosylase SLT domain-containing protein n=1 Tax=Chloracidobacterium validum TaxID=2821543 RepID=A0ABX8BC76_9BACT|nr:transglycosylase SLT domain-containing protein [Chloracidobacterium validum]QUW04443.1 transglycosylase SLT domain-containing protein [Chloracidobacterium validum]
MATDQTIQRTDPSRIRPDALLRQPASTRSVGKTAFETRLEQALGADSQVQRRTREELKTIVMAVQSGFTDPWQLTDLIFQARHPELIGADLSQSPELLDEWNEISAQLVQPTLNDLVALQSQAQPSAPAAPVSSASTVAAGTRVTGKDKLAAASALDPIIEQAVALCPGLPPQFLKSLLVQESGLRTDVVNQYGYAGVAQIGRREARELGLAVGVPGTESDERLNPSLAIPAAARLLHVKAQRLTEMAFSRYGTPQGAEYWKFVMGAYNGGEGTITVAMGHAYRDGLARAREEGLAGPEAVAFAREWATKWEHLALGGEDAPLALAAARYFPKLAAQKFVEIRNYPEQIVARVARRRTAAG